MGVAYIPVARVEDVSEGVLTPSEMSGRQVLVTRIEGEYHVFSRECPHAEGDLAEGELTGTRIRCNGHNYVYDVVSGECTVPVGASALPVMPVEVRGEEICVRLEW